MNTKTLLVLVAIILVAGTAYFLVNGSSTGTYSNPFSSSQSQVSSNPSDELNQLDNSNSDFNQMNSDFNSFGTEISGL